MHIGPTAHTPLALGRIEVGLLPSPLGLTTNVRTFMMLAVEPGRSERVCKWVSRFPGSPLG